MHCPLGALHTYTNRCSGSASATGSASLSLSTSNDRVFAIKLAGDSKLSSFVRELFGK